MSSIFSSFMVKMLWLRGELVSDLHKKEKKRKSYLLLEDWFIFVAAALLFLFP